VRRFQNFVSELVAEPASQNPALAAPQTKAPRAADSIS
jgi:hypothetical protein